MLGESPFETYVLHRGRKRGNYSIFGKKKKDSYKRAGVFKGLIRVVFEENPKPLFDLQRLLRPQNYVVRVYVLRGLRLQSLDDGGKSDPYLKVSTTRLRSSPVS